MKSICKKDTLLATTAVIYITARATKEGSNIFFCHLYTEYPIHTASGIWMNTGSTLDGYVINKFAITQEKTTFTISTTIIIINKNNIFVRSTRLNSSHVSISYAVF